MKFLLWPGLMCPRVAPNSLCTLPWLWTPEHPSSTSQVLANMSLFMWPWGWGQDLVNAGQAPYQNSLELLMFFLSQVLIIHQTGLKPSIAQATFRNLTLLTPNFWSCRCVPPSMDESRLFWSLRRSVPKIRSAQHTDKASICLAMNPLGLCKDSLLSPWPYH